MLLLLNLKSCENKGHTECFVMFKNSEMSLVLKWNEVSNLNEFAKKKLESNFSSFHEHDHPCGIHTS